MGLWINKIGIEVECAVSTRYDIEGFRTTADGSIESRRGFRTAEYVSNPFNYQNLFSNQELVKPSLETCVHDLYDIVREVNDSMGLHIHVSLTKEINNQRLASMRFYEFFMDRLRKSNLWNKHPELRNRANGHNSYAKSLKKSTTIDSHLRGSGSRYRHINFSALSDHGTIEFRIFPAMNSPEDVMEAVDFTTTTINKYFRNKMYRQEFKKRVQEGENESVVNTRTVEGKKKVIKEEYVASVDGERVEPNNKPQDPLRVIQQGLNEVRNNV